MVQNLEKEEIKIHADRLQQDQNVSVLFLFTPICHYYPYHAKKHWCISNVLAFLSSSLFLIYWLPNLKHLASGSTREIQKHVSNEAFLNEEALVGIPSMENTFKIFTLVFYSACIPSPGVRSWGVDVGFLCPKHTIIARVIKVLI